MRTAAVSELKAKLSEHLAWVKRGEEVLVTERGIPVARIVPVAAGDVEDERMRGLVAKGIVRPGRGQLRRALSDAPICNVSEGAVLRALDEEREERG